MKKGKIENEDYKLIQEELNHFIIRYPSENEINSTIEELRQYVPNKRKKSVDYMNRLMVLLRLSGMELNLISKSYWGISLILYILGFYISQSLGNNPLLTLLILIPIPIGLGLFEVFKGRDVGMMEMEMACKFSAMELILSRLLLIGIYNFILNIVLTIGLTRINTAISGLEMLVVWFSFLIVFSAISLYLSMKLRGKAFLATNISIWAIFSMILFRDERFLDILIRTHGIVYILLIIIGLATIYLQIRHLMVKYSSLEEVALIESTY